MNLIHTLVALLKKLFLRQKPFIRQQRTRVKPKLPSKEVERSGETEPGTRSPGLGPDCGQAESGRKSGLPAQDKQEIVSVRAGASEQGLGEWEGEWSSPGRVPNPLLGLDAIDAFKQVPSPNFNGRRELVKCTIIHYTVSGPSANGVARLFSKKSAKVSAHFVIGADGAIIQCVDLEKRAWHAGRANSPFGKRVNDHSIGIELCNWGWVKDGKNAYGRKYTGRATENKEGKEWEPFAEKQLVALDNLLGWLAENGYKDATENLLGHNEVAPKRKIDPGPLFPWSRFR